MADLDLSKAIEAVEDVFREDDHNGTECRPARPLDFTAAAAVRAALPQVLEALAVAIETEAQEGPDNAPNFRERHLAENRLRQIRSLTSLIRAKAQEADRG